MGALRENIYMCDSKGLITTERTEGMNKYKAQYAQHSSLHTLADVIGRRRVRGPVRGRDR
jgi:malate dehydrogenase (oxaloacetate-decarboxylating)(NADP+)